ncbi:MAG: DNA polymerase III subunit delta' [Micrococcales bacterium]|nr:DNA polymerase III subunit delta' [Micrococcales bacterium]
MGQPGPVQILRKAAAEPGSMTHAWLITGPPGSGRSVAARAFAAGLQCSRGGCGECDDCRAVMHRTHPDVLDAATQKVVIGIDEAREWVTLAARAPAMGRWRVLLIEDADRMLERTGNVLLKSLEEPPQHTVWILTAPSPADVLVTVRSRCRLVNLGIPPVQAVVDVLVRDGVAAETARTAALAAECHIGLARRLATNSAAAAWRCSVLDVPAKAASVALAVLSASRLDEAAKAQAEAVIKEREGAARDELLSHMGESTRGRLTSYGRARVKEFDEESKKRAKRGQVDTLDRALTYLLAYYRDVLVVQFGAQVELVNADQADLVTAGAHTSTVAQTMVALAAIEQARVRVAANVAPAVALEAMAVALALPQLVAAEEIG